MKDAKHGSVTLKIMGERQNVLDFIEALEQVFSLSHTSRVIPDRQDETRALAFTDIEFYILQQEA